jgi:hypothetical protein
LFGKAVADRNPHAESLTEKAGNKIMHNIGVIARSVSDEATQLSRKHWIASLRSQ